MTQTKTSFGLKWICNACGYKLNSVQRVRCRSCTKKKSGEERLWKYTGQKVDSPKKLPVRGKK